MVNVLSEEIQLQSAERVGSELMLLGRSTAVMGKNLELEFVQGVALSDSVVTQVAPDLDSEASQFALVVAGFVCVASAVE